MLLDKDQIEVFHTPNEAKCLREVLAQIPEGELIEVGVYLGGSAKIISEIYPLRELHAFDTFEGFPDDISVEDGDSPKYRVGDMNNATLEIVQKNLKDYPNITLIKGRFPDTGKPYGDKTFAFAHVDVDTYQGTKDAIEFIYPRVVAGGSILIHDYPAHNGVKKAIDEYMKPRSGEMILLGNEGRQLLIKKHGTS